MPDSLAADKGARVHFQAGTTALVYTLLLASLMGVRRWRPWPAVVKEVRHGEYVPIVARITDLSDQARAEGVEKTAQAKHCENYCRQERLEQMFAPGRSPVSYSSSEVLDPLFFFKVAIESRLKRSVHSVFMIHFEPHESEWLMT